MSPLTGYYPGAMAERALVAREKRRLPIIKRHLVDEALNGTWLRDFRPSDRNDWPPFIVTRNPDA